VLGWYCWQCHWGFWNCCWWCLEEWSGRTGNVPRVLAGSVALDAVAPTALLPSCTYVSRFQCVLGKVIRAGGPSLTVTVVGWHVRKYSSSAIMNLHVAATNGLSPMIGRGLANGQRSQGPLGGWLPGRLPKCGWPLNMRTVCMVSPTTSESSDSMAP